MNDFLRHVARFTGTPQLLGRSLGTIQINLGPRCTLECHHCHLGASPRREEAMSREIMEALLRQLHQLPHGACHTAELTGGTPELHPSFRELVAKLCALVPTVRVRTNLVIHQEADRQDLAPFLRDHQVILTGSLPCYLEENVDRQRGDGTFRQSIAAIRRLNTLGYGVDPRWLLELVYNPGDATLPPDQGRLETQYRQQLHDRFGIHFSRLATITNMPIGRFRADLRRQGQEQAYHTLLQRAFNPQTLEQLMCRHQISVGWDGRLFDCDFNLALGIPMNTPHPRVETLAATPATRAIATGDHCLACTAGAGSSCGGALVA
ncbi:MAG: arsenosugar biosynthesis radical SAM protein ArsS [Magnetococcales bacterium]|nr:arsenosugar biosynthesis radical SAM protein ArsS [Magnetococcales bacterium]